MNKVSGHSSNFNCNVSGLNANANSNGNVNSNDDASANCEVDNNGISNCWLDGSNPYVTAPSSYYICSMSNFRASADSGGFVNFSGINPTLCGISVNGGSS